MSVLLIFGAFRRGANRSPAMSQKLSGGRLRPDSGIANRIDSMGSAWQASREQPILSLATSHRSDVVEPEISIHLCADRPLAERAALPPALDLRRNF